MDYVRFGTTGLHVSRLCLGCMTYGDPAWREWVLDEAAAGRSSATPGKPASTSSTPPTCTRLGASEEVLGRALKEFARRDEVVIATKVFNPMGPASPTRRACRASTSWRRSTPR